MNGWMDPLKKGRSEGRVLFFGITKSEKILTYLAIPDSRIAKEINDYPSVEITGVINQLNKKGQLEKTSSKDIHLQELRKINQLNRIKSKRYKYFLCL